MDAEITGNAQQVYPVGHSVIPLF